jgi:hypothetical protein
MKTYLLILILSLFACSSNKQTQLDLSYCNFNDKILESEKILDANPYVKGSGGWTLIDNDSCKIRVSSGSEGFSKRIHNKITDIIKVINYDKLTFKVNYSNFYYNKGNFNIGNEYIYNEQGEVVKTIDHNQYSKYPICYKEIIQSTIKKAGNKFYFQGLERDSIVENNQNKYCWKVFFEDSITKYPTLRHKFFRIDAKTGKTIVEEIIP